MSKYTLVQDYGKASTDGRCKLFSVAGTILAYVLVIGFCITLSVSIALLQIHWSN